ncbi:hypothetical protein SynA1544_01663 [Synechococcus sp. A15-44]|nr:hypothetical protein SynA1544_01663 [Synechococcus sp. A15-44]
MFCRPQTARRCTPEELPQTSAVFIQNHADNAAPKEAEKNSSR